MSKLTSAHNMLFRYADKLHHDLAPAFNVNPDDVDLDGSAKHYEKRDGYRTINITSDSRAYLVALGNELYEMAKGLKSSLRINLEISGSARNRKERILCVYVKNSVELSVDCRF